MTTIPGSVTVGGLLQIRQETPCLDLELLAGSVGFTRRITSPYVRKTDFALINSHDPFGIAATRTSRRVADQLRDSEIEEGSDPREEQ